MKTFIEILNDPEARQLVEAIEELLYTEDAALVRTCEGYILELAARFGYQYQV